MAPHMAPLTNQAAGARKGKAEHSKTTKRSYPPSAVVPAVPSLAKHDIVLTLKEKCFKHPIHVHRAAVEGIWN